MNDQEWSEYKNWLLEDAFRLTVSITGQRDQHVYAESADVSTSENLPRRIKRIFFNNITAYRRHANGEHPKTVFQSC